MRRDRLRWSVEPDNGVPIGLHDQVEIWCCGNNVPGAWLEATVRKVRGRRYCVGRVLSNGALWVERERLRLAHAKRVPNEDAVPVSAEGKVIGLRMRIAGSPTCAVM